MNKADDLNFIMNFNLHEADSLLIVCCDGEREDDFTIYKSSSKSWPPSPSEILTQVKARRPWAKTIDIAASKSWQVATDFPVKETTS